MNVSERGRSSEWEPLTREGEPVAEVWFRPNDDPLALVFRIPESRFQIDDLAQLLTVEDLLVAAAIPVEHVESWQFLDEAHAGEGGANLELKRVLPPPPSGETHLTVHLRLTPPGQPAAGDEVSEQDVSPETWQTLDAIWKSIQNLEATIDSLRLSMGGLVTEMEGAFKRALTVEEKVHALQADVAQWTKAKNLGRYAIPKVREFVHRATWAAATPERKRLEELVETHLKPRIPLPDMREVRGQLEHMQKDRQVLLAVGNAVNQECRGILSEIQRTVSSLQRNATQRAREKRSAGRNKGKHL